MLINQWKISHKLIGVFGLILLSLILVGGFAIYRINTINTAAGLIGDDVDGLGSVGLSRTSLFESQVALEQAFNEKPGAARDALLSTAAGKRDTSFAEWKKFAKVCLPGEECGYADKVNALWQPYIDAVKSLTDNSSGAVGPDALKATLKLGYDVAAAMQGNTDYQVREAHDAVVEAASITTQSEMLVGVGLGIVVLVSLGLFSLLLKNLVGPIRQLTAAMDRLAGNKTETDVPGLGRKDELGAMARTVQVFKDGIVKRFALEANAAGLQHSAEQDRSTRDAAKAEDSKRTAFAMTALAEGLERLSRGELVYRINEPFAAAYDKLRQDFNGALEKLQDTMKVVAGNTSAIRSGSDEISAAADDLSKRTEQQAASLEETAAALDEVTATVRKTAEGANHARQVVGNAKKDAEHSGEIVRRAVEAMNGIEKSSGQIGQIIGVIDEIAFQTNLLALNAGVEAARAGEAGRGFAVVASEVRALAQRSAEAAKEIKALISASGQHVGQGVDLVGQTGLALERIVGQVAEINAIVVDIAASAQEQATGLDQVNTAVNQMDQATQKNAAMVEESTAASHALVRETEELARIIGGFTTGQDAGRAVSRPERRPAPPSRKPAEATPALKTTGRGGAARKPEPAAKNDDWTEF